MEDIHFTSDTTNYNIIYSGVRDIRLFEPGEPVCILTQELGYKLKLEKGVVISFTREGHDGNLENFYTVQLNSSKENVIRNADYIFRDKEQAKIELIRNLDCKYNSKVREIIKITNEC